MAITLDKNNTKLVNLVVGLSFLCLEGFILQRKRHPIDFPTCCWTIDEPLDLLSGGENILIFSPKANFFMVRSRAKQEQSL